MGSGWSSEEERQPLLGPGLGPAPGAAWRSREAAAALPAAAPSPGRVYGRRWLVLLLFSLLGFAQGLVWNTWGPIQNSARQAYGFSSWDIALLVLWGPIGLAAILRSWEATIQRETVDTEERAEGLSQHSHKEPDMRHCVL